jgi:hypothetical protein
MPTLMVMDLNKMNEASTDLGKIDPHLYQQLTRSLMYLVITIPCCPSLYTLANVD